MPDGCLEEFDGDMAAPLHDLTNTSTCPPNDIHFTYTDADIDLLSKELSIPWELSKTILFTMVALPQFSLGPQHLHGGSSNRKEGKIPQHD